MLHREGEQLELHGSVLEIIRPVMELLTNNVGELGLGQGQQQLLPQA